jgi:hypothetical protein
MKYYDVKMNRGIFPKDRDQSIKLTTHLHLVLRIRTGGSLVLLGMTLPFTVKPGFYIAVGPS